MKVYVKSFEKVGKVELKAADAKWFGTAHAALAYARKQKALGRVVDVCIATRTLQQRSIFERADSKLTRIASEVLRVLHEVDAVEDEMRAFGAPSECAALAYKSLEESMKFVLYVNGYEDGMKLYDDLAQRMGEKQAMMFFGEVLDVQVDCKFCRKCAARIQSWWTNCCKCGADID